MTTTVRELYASFPETEYMESNITYYSFNEYTELQNHQWFEVVSSVISSTVDASEVIEACDSLEDSEYFTLDGCEYRVIHDDDIFSTFLDEFEELVRDCYIPRDFPSFLKIDWEASAREVLMSNGYAHHFSSWDGDFHKEVAGYNIFRVG